MRADKKVVQNITFNVNGFCITKLSFQISAVALRDFNINKSALHTHLLIAQSDADLPPTAEQSTGQSAQATRLGNRPRLLDWIVGLGLKPYPVFLVAQLSDVYLFGHGKNSVQIVENSFFYYFISVINTRLPWEAVIKGEMNANSYRQCSLVLDEGLCHKYTACLDLQSLHEQYASSEHSCRHVSV